MGITKIVNYNVGGILIINKTYLIDNIKIIFSICILVLGIFISGCSKKDNQTYHIGVLCGLDYFASIVETFKDEMSKNGYVEGKNITYDIKFTNFEPENGRYPPTFKSKK